MRYYSTIIVNLSQNLIKIYDLATPCTKKEAILWAKNTSPNTHVFRGRMSVARILGSKESNVDNTFRSLVNANPEDKI